MQVTLLHNPSAGKGQVTKKDLLAACKLAGLEAAYFSTKATDIKKALDQRADLVVVAGGDGTVSKVACEMLHRKVPLAIVPLGNANNIARSLGIAGTVHELAESWAQKRTQPLDIALAYGPWGSRKFVEAVGVGPLAQVIENNEESDKKHGAENLRQGRKELRQAFKKGEAHRYRLSLDNREVEGRFVAIEIANIAYTGPGLELSPKSAPGDAVLNVVCVRPADRDKIVDWLEAPHEAPQPLRAKRGRKISFEWKDGPLRIDDDVLPAPKEPEEVNVELAGTIEVVVPEKKAAGEDGKSKSKKNSNGKKNGNGKKE
jgi:diacylglycerol kinase family enzyme